MGRYVIKIFPDHRVADLNGQGWGRKAGTIDGNIVGGRGGGQGKWKKQAENQRDFDETILRGMIEQAGSFLSGVHSNDRMSLTLVNKRYCF